MKSTKRKLTTLRRMDKPARKAYCTGCGVTFDNMHGLINHRRSDRCGGRFLPVEERAFFNKLRAEREFQARQDRFWARMEAE